MHPTLHVRTEPNFIQPTSDKPWPSYTARALSVRYHGDAETAWQFPSWDLVALDNRNYGECCMPAMKYLRFYLERGCVVVPGWGKTKRVRRGCDRWTLADTQRNLEMLKKNAKVVNGTGGLLILDVDPKNGGSIEWLHRRFPDLPATRTVQTVTPHPDGFGTHLIFMIPDDVRVGGRQLAPGIDVPHAVMLPGSVILCDDGVERRYELVNEIEPAPAPLALIASVDKGQDLGAAAAVEPDDEGADDIVESLVARFADAGAGERNETLLQVAPMVIRLKGAEGADMLRMAYSGDDDRWLESALKGALAKYAGSAAPNWTGRSRYVTKALGLITQQVRYGCWRGATGSTDRKVLLGIVRMCASRRRMTAVCSARTLALLTGLEPKTVVSAVTRLVESGHLCVVGKDGDGAPEYTPIAGKLTAGCRNRSGGDGAPEYSPIAGELTTVLSKRESPPRGFPVDPLHDVWLGDGLTGRHSHVFDLVSVGARRAKEIATAGGMGYDTARDALAKLVDAGMLDRQGTAYSVPADVVEIADTLAVELCGRLRRAKLAERIREERARPRGDAAQLAVDDVVDVDADDLGPDGGRWDQEELMRQLGLI